MQAEYDLQQIIGALVHASRWNKFQETETHQENMKESCVFTYDTCTTVGSDAVKILSVCIAASLQSLQFYFYSFGQINRENRWEGRGGRNERGCMVDRLGA